MKHLQQTDVPYYLNPEFIERFWLKCDRTGGPDSCWLWQESLVQGYAQVRTTAPLNMRRAHAVALEIHLGRRLGPGKGVHSNRLQANHIRACPNKHCVNPAHLYEGTAKDNMQDAIAAGTHPSVAQRAKTSCPRGHTYDTTNSDGSRRCSICAAEANRQCAQRRLLGLTRAAPRQGKAPLFPCTHNHQFDFTDNRGSTICRVCMNEKRRRRAQARREGLASVRPLAAPQFKDLT